MSEHTTSMLLVLSAARVLYAVDLDKVIANAEHALSFGPFLDPTAWRDNHQKLEEDLTVLRAALPLWKLAHSLGHKLESDSP